MKNLVNSSALVLDCGNWSAPKDATFGLIPPVPIETKKLKGLDSLLSIVQMPKGCPVATMAINGSFNAGLLAASIIGNYDKKIKKNLENWKKLQTKSIKKKP